ncbi:bifunctional phosphatase PAP2/diacylglycerol kinase family protein [Nakamurella lactea]|uniref:bifunctional phosphatase PAP2/diacylglycerol kinase family protein n=1 Tax=Nakamurella lactea TaxID=459515 RepID=UPI000424ACD9|nr:bifunctional phosphatase PAP2/diacylglycerol kinase family protein [Nakamurella lactea]
MRRQRSSTAVSLTGKPPVVRFAGLIKPHQAFPLVARIDRAVNRRTNAVHLGPAADHRWWLLSRSADRSLLWAGIGVVLAATGVRGRRAAGRGYASLLVASAVSNVFGKGLFGGDRPSLETTPFPRHRGRQPKSPSFPSGHSSSAAAFAIGAALEWPAAGAVIAPLAGAVMYSRLHTGAHWFSDVAGGAAIGAGVALAGRALVPPPAAPTAAIPSGPRYDVPALPGGAGLFVIINPHSGSGRPFREDPIETISKALPQARIHVLHKDDDVSAIYASAIDRGLKAIGICGGDGTVAAAAATARQHNLPLAVFPGGTFNHFAKSAGLATMERAITAIESGSGIAADVADLAMTVDGNRTTSTVLNTFAIGIYPQLVELREKREKRLGKALATVWAAGRLLRTAQPVRIRVNGEDGNYFSLFVGVNRYYPQNLAPIDRPRLDDEVLDVRTATAAPSHSRLRTFLELSVGDHGRRVTGRIPWVRRRLTVVGDTTALVDLEFDGDAGSTVTLAHDGETVELPARGSRAELRITAHALRVYAPVQE